LDVFLGSQRTPKKVKAPSKAPASGQELFPTQAGVFDIFDLPESTVITTETSWH